MVHVVSGFLIWAGGFMALYALQAVGCAQGWGALRPMLIAVAAGFAIASLLALAASRRLAPGFIRQVSLLANVAAGAAFALNFSPLFWLPLCT